MNLATFEGVQRGEESGGKENDDGEDGGPEVDRLDLRTVEIASLIRQ